MIEEILQGIKIHLRIQVCMMEAILQQRVVCLWGSIPEADF